MCSSPCEAFSSEPGPKVLHNQDPRVTQVNVGVSQDHMIEREANIISQAHAAVNEARFQSANEVNAMRSQIVVVQQQVQSHA